MKKLTVTLSERERYLGLIYLLLEFFVLPIVLYYANTLLQDPLSDTLINLVYFSVNFLCVVIICRGFLWRSLKQLSKRVLPILRYVLLGFVLYELGVYLVNLIAYFAMPDFTNVNDAAIFAMGQDYFIPVSIGLVLLVPVVEETLYRGLIFGAFYERSRVLAYALSTVVFASIHVVSYLGAYSPLLLSLCFLQYIPAGLCLAWAYAKADNIFAPILIHMTINLIGVFTMR